MNKKLALLPLLLISTGLQAATLDDLTGPLGGLYQQMKASWSSSNSFSIVESLDREECYESIEDLKDDANSYELLSVTYYRSKIEEADLTGAYSSTISSKRSERYKPGLKEYTSFDANSFSEKEAPHLLPGCKKHIKINKVDMVQVNLPENTMATCRKVNLGIDDMDYDLLYCVGEQNLYANYSQDLNYSILESVEKLSN